MWETLAILVVSTILTVLLAPKQPRAKPDAITDFDVPKVEEGQTIGVLLGTKIIKSPNVLWYGDLKVEEIKEKGGKK